jgi:multidrug efflux pump subunit AcrA (membrane-fusion protein)
MSTKSSRLPWKRRRGAILLYSGLTAALVASGAMAYAAVQPATASTPSNARVVTAQTGTVTRSVSATGNVQPATSLNVGFSTTGTVSEIDVALGQQVAAGAVLAKLDPTAAQANLQIAQLNLTSAEAKLTTAESPTAPATASGGGSSSVASLQVTLTNDQQALADVKQQAAVNAAGYQLAINQAQTQLAKDQQQLANDNGTPAASQDQAAVDKDQSTLATAQQNQAAGLAKDQQSVDQANAKVASDGAALSTAQTPATVDPSAVASAQAAVLQAQSAVTSAQKALDATTLTAPAAGTVTALNGVVGQAVSGSGTTAATTASQPSSSSTGGTGASATTSTSPSTTSTSSFLTLDDMSAMQVKVGFAEIDAVNVKMGQPATITVSALTGTQLTGTVVEVDPTASVVNNVVTYNALVSINTPPPTLKQGMTASVSVQVASHPNVLEVPTAAIQTQGGTSVVNVDVAGKPVPTTVTTGLQGDSTTEITSGLTAGQQLLVSTGATTTATGARTGAGAAVPGAGGGGGFTGGGGGGGFTGGGGGFGGGAG